MLGEDGYPQIVKASEHGLGHLLNPTDPESDDRDWIREAWRLIVCEALGLRTTSRTGSTGRHSPSSRSRVPRMLRPFEDYNRGRPPRERVRPGSFVLTAQVVPFGYPDGVDPSRFRLIAPYEPDPRRWRELSWRNLYDGAEYPVAFEGDPSPDVVRGKTYRDVIGLTRRSRSRRATAPTGTLPSRDRRPPRRRPVTMSTLSLIGKESNKLDERAAGLIGCLDDVLATYEDGREAWDELVCPAIGDLPTQSSSSEAGSTPRTIQRLRARQTCPRAQHRAALVLIAADLIGELMAGAGIVVPEDPAARLALYVDKRERLSRRCPECGRPPISSRAVYCSSTCKKRGYRKRSRRQPGSEADGADGASGSTP